MFPAISGTCDGLIKKFFRSPSVFVRVTRSATLSTLDDSVNMQAAPKSGLLTPRLASKPRFRHILTTGALQVSVSIAIPSNSPIIFPSELITSSPITSSRANI